MKYLLLAAFIHVSLITSSQVISILDSKTKQPIPYATIRWNTVQGGTYTGADGRADLHNNFKDTIFISSIGYESRIIILRNVQHDSVLLVPTINELPSVTVQSLHAMGEQTLGIIHAKKFGCWTGTGFGEEFAQRISFPDSTKTYKIKSVSIGMERFDETIPTVLHIYNLADGRPGNDMLLKKIVLRKSNYKKRKEKLIVDLGSENILINDTACFVGIEWMPVFAHHQPSSAIVITDDFTEPLTFIRSHYYYGGVKWLPTILLPGQVHAGNTVISVTVEVLK
jgi:hypothetical protein